MVNKIPQHRNSFPVRFLPTDTNADKIMVGCRSDYDGSINRFKLQHDRSLVAAVENLLEEMFKFYDLCIDLTVFYLSRCFARALKFAK